MSNTYRIEDPDTGTVRVIENVTSAIDAVFWAAQTITWARGYNFAGVVWPFAPHVLVDGQLACDVVAEQGGSWAEGARRYAEAVAPVVRPVDITDADQFPEIAAAAAHAASLRA